MRVRTESTPAFFGERVPLTAELLRTWLKVKKLSVNELARRSHVSRRAIQRFLSGDTKKFHYTTEQAILLQADPNRKADR